MAIGTARGSVGGSRVAYVADIIDLNPETWHTVFSRFCNEDRVEIGDIDIDCIESDRPAIFKHITSRFGEDKTARVASFGTMQSKGLIDDVGRALSSDGRANTEHRTIILGLSTMLQKSSRSLSPTKKRRRRSIQSYSTTMMA